MKKDQTKKRVKWNIKLTSRNCFDQNPWFAISKMAKNQSLNWKSRNVISRKKIYLIFMKNIKKFFFVKLIYLISEVFCLDFYKKNSGLLCSILMWCPKRKTTNANAATSSFCCVSIEFQLEFPENLSNFDDLWYTHVVHLVFWESRICVRK